VTQQLQYSTALEAIQLIESGNRVYIGSNCGQPVVLTDALGTRHDLQEVEIVHLLTFGGAPYMAREGMWHKAFFMSGNTRTHVNEGRADYIPIFLSEIPHLFLKGEMPIDVAMVCVSPPDEHGYCSLGISVDVGLAACRVAKKIIAEVNPNMPRTLGDAFIHVDDISCMVWSERPMLEHDAGEIDEISHGIAKNIAELVSDGCCIQTGIGKIPSALLPLLTEKNDLGVHTEMFSDPLIDLIDRGVVNCRAKNVMKGHVVSTFAIGTRKLYDYADNNPFFAFHPTELVNDPFTVASNDNMIAINSAIEVDLTGQVVSDSIGRRIYSGIGGQVDFIRGAARSKGGKPIIAIPSLTPKGVSKICPEIAPGAGVVTSRGDVHYVVTEHGIAYLHGKSLGERCEALINISHPSVRDELTEKAKELGLWRQPRWLS
jgi:acetyl-CoA hydrolase